MPSSVVTDGLKLWWSWAGKADRPFVQPIFLTPLVAMFTVATLAAGILSSLIVKRSNVVVLLNSPFGGAILPPTPAYKAAVGELSDTYSSKCCSNPYRSGACKIFLTPQNTSCPFDPSMCSHSSLSFDSGLLNFNGIQAGIT